MLPWIIGAAVVIGVKALSDSVAKKEREEEEERQERREQREEKREAERRQQEQTRFIKGRSEYEKKKQLALASYQQVLDAQELWNEFAGTWTLLPSAQQQAMAEQKAALETSLSRCREALNNQMRQASAALEAMRSDCGSEGRQFFDQESGALKQQLALN